MNIKDMKFAFLEGTIQTQLQPGTNIQYHMTMY